MRVKLKDIATIITKGTTPTSIGYAFQEEGVNFIKIESISENGEFILEKFAHISEDCNAKMKRSQLQEDDILFSIAGAIGRTAVVKKDILPANTNQALAIIRIPKGIINYKYLLYVLQSQIVTEQADKKKQGVAQVNLSLKDIGELEIPIYAEEVQVKIVTTFNYLDQLMSIRKQQLSKLDELVKSRFIGMFIGKDYPLKTVDEISLGKGEYGAQSASIAYDASRPRYVRITDINDDGTLNDDTVSSINFADDDLYRLEYGDFMFARMGATVGKTYAFIEGNQIFAGYLIRYKLNKELINPRYLFYYTKLDIYWNWVKLNQSGAAQPGINAKKYGSLQIPLPPIDIQNEFATFVEQTDKLKSEIKESLEKLETLKKSLMQKYFG